MDMAGGYGLAFCEFGKKFVSKDSRSVSERFCKNTSNMRKKRMENVAFSAHSRRPVSARYQKIYPHKRRYFCGGYGAYTNQDTIDTEIIQDNTL